MQTMPIKTTYLAYLRYRAPELTQARRFLTDFGLEVAQADAGVLYARAAGPAPYVCVVEEGAVGSALALGLGVASVADLERARDELGGSAIEAIDAPGGGQRVRLACPAPGCAVELVHGIAPASARPIRAPRRVNYGTEKARLGQVQAPATGAVQVLRLGHVVLGVPQLAASLRLFRDQLGMLVSDQICDDASGEPRTAFLRFDRGDEFVDHHAVALSQRAEPEVRLRHAAFELQDIDAVHEGGRWLTEQGYRHEWGVGRHVLGSQLFDYWRDPFGHVFEHYADGDLFDSSAPTGSWPASGARMAQWGPPVPATFTA